VLLNWLQIILWFLKYLIRTSRSLYY